MRLRTYRCFGLGVASEIELIEFPPGPPDMAPDITIRRAPGMAARVADATRSLEDAEFAPVAGGHAMRIEGAHILVRDGREILVDAEPDADPGLLRLFLLGSAMGMALHQRGRLVLHGATVLSRPGEAAIFVGESGEGKSTMAALLASQGRPVYGDDTMAVERGPDGVVVWPGSLMFKLWSDTVDLLGPDAGAPVASLGNRLDKYFWGNPTPVPDRPARLRRVYLLEASYDTAEPRLEPLVGLAALRVLVDQTYRPTYLRLLGREAEHFRQCAALAPRLDVWKLVRPWDSAQISRSVELVERHWEASSEHSADNSLA